MIEYMRQEPPDPVDLCAACLRLFRESDHPEAVAYRRAFERV